ncbi:MAG: MFS transporter [Pseudomonadales bacterium]
MMDSNDELLRQHWLVISAFAGVFCSSLVLPYYASGALLLPITAEFGWSRAEFQSAMLFSQGLGALTGPLVGWLIDRYGARRIALPGIFGVSVGFALAANMSGPLWMLYLAYGAMALLGAGSIPVTWTRAITTNFERRRGIALGLILSGTGVCAILAPLYTTWLLTAFGWRTAYLGLALLPLVIAAPVVLLKFRPAERLGSDPQSGAPLWGYTLGQAFHLPRYWVLLASIFAVYLAVSGIAPNLIPALTDDGIDPSRAALALSCFGAAIIVGRLLVGYLIDLYWAPGVAALALSLPVLGCWLLLGEPSFATALIAAALIGIGAGAELDLMSFLAARYFGLAHYAKIYAVLYASLAICSGTAPMLFAWVYDTLGSYDVAFSVAAGLFALGAVLVLCLGRYPDIAVADSYAGEPHSS